ncbi:MAG TPA: ATP-binding cassette domain-containing protein [Synergistaceae bacterium]|nr:ATP-binding cassette domain-containing protein [Synergistaceae bacterium]HPJ26238.1 ATP-binding cassette domain-containing protein [Synergistaceae bacterium]HPQ36425.1 ATP-binding cassette domain-containing protein [Synergistaceae bacterium]
MSSLLRVENLVKHFPLSSGVFGGPSGVVHAVDGVSFTVEHRETFALVGESGCGKTTLGRLLLRLLEKTGGEVYFENQEIFSLPPEKMRILRKKMQIIFQDPYASLNPRMRIRSILAEPLETHTELSRSEIRSRVAELLELVGLSPEAMAKYPHQFSGGQRQRVGIARALALNPEFIVCDEAVSALDVSIQAQILNLLKDLQERFSLTYLFITHDLSVVRHLADRVSVMFLGKSMEIGNTRDIFEAPLHPYTKFLISAVPVPDPRKREREKMILQGDIPSPVNLPPGCRFHTRCPYAQPRCREEEPPFVFSGGRGVACHYPLD